jgi:hypothetical protein
VALASIALAGCGEEESFSDGEIAKAIEVKNGAVGGDPFCVVKDYLNDAEEVDKADRKDGPAVSSAQGGVGVVVEPPFPADCERKVRAGLNKLDPRTDGESK